ncbi:MAG: hypothetical protein P0121_12695 [Nitrospira sp.]|nr:hypothetical protein [Nitrospira sp.]
MRSPAFPANDLRGSDARLEAEVASKAASVWQQQQQRLIARHPMGS